VLDASVFNVFVAKSMKVLEATNGSVHTTIPCLLCTRFHTVSFSPTFMPTVISSSSLLILAAVQTT